jgi:hypothetical protein
MAEDNQIELDLTAEDPSGTEVEVISEDSEKEDSGSSDSFERADNATQKRIDRLTKKMREAERREGEALNFAKQVQGESQQLKSRMANLDTSYVNEYTNRVTTQLTQAEQEYARAMEMGDSQAAVEANRKLTSLSIENDRASQAKMQQERAYAQQAQQQQAAPQQQQQQEIRRPDRKAENWAEKNEWFGQDDAMTYAAFGIHKTLVEEEGFDPKSDEYSSKRAVQTVAGVSRSSSGRSSGRKVRLTPSQVAIAKKLGVPLEEYAKYVKE